MAAEAGGRARLFIVDKRIAILAGQTKRVGALGIGKLPDLARRFERAPVAAVRRLTGRARLMIAAAAGVRRCQRPLEPVVVIEIGDVHRMYRHRPPRLAAGSILSTSRSSNSRKRRISSGLKAASKIDFVQRTSRGKSA